MVKPDMEQLIDSWLTFSNEEVDTPIYKEYFWAYSEVASLLTDDPSKAWEIIQKFCSREMTERQELCFACGPLEVFVHEHGKQYIDQIEAFAAANPKLAELLGGVWRSDAVADEIWTRIEVLRGEPWGP